LLSFPLTALADGLGRLSLSGRTGNAFSVVLYALICLIPVFTLLFKLKKNTFRRVDSLLVLMSAVLFAVMYLLINPSEMGLQGEFDGAPALVAFSFWSLFVGYLVLKFADTLKNTEGKRAENLLSVVIKFIGAVFMFVLCTVEIPKTEVGIITVFSAQIFPHLLFYTTGFDFKYAHDFNLTSEIYNNFEERGIIVSKKVKEIFVKSKIRVGYSMLNIV